MKQRLLTILLAVAVLFTATACLDYEEVLTLNADGSGRISLHISVDKRILNRMQSMAGPNADPAGEKPEKPDELCSEEEIRAALEAMGSGLELVAYSETDNEEQLAYDIEFRFSDYDDFRDLNDVCPDESAAADNESQFDFSYAEQPDGSWLFTRRFMSMEEESEEYSSVESGDPTDGWEEDASEYDDTEMVDSEAEDLPEPVDMAKLAEALKGLGQALEGLDTEALAGGDSAAPRTDVLAGFTAGMQEMAEDAKDHTVRLVVNLPGTVIESNGTAAEGGTVTWEYTLDAMAQAPKTATAKVKP